MRWSCVGRGGWSGVKYGEGVEEDALERPEWTVHHVFQGGILKQCPYSVRSINFLNSQFKSTSHFPFI